MNNDDRSSNAYYRDWIARDLNKKTKTGVLSGDWRSISPVPVLLTAWLATKRRNKAFFCVNQDFFRFFIQHLYEHHMKYKKRLTVYFTCRYFSQWTGGIAYANDSRIDLIYFDERDLSALSLLPWNPLPRSYISRTSQQGDKTSCGIFAFNYIRLASNDRDFVNYVLRTFVNEQYEHRYHLPPRYLRLTQSPVKLQTQIDELKQRHPLALDSLVNKKGLTLQDSITQNKVEVTHKGMLKKQNRTLTHMHDGQSGHKRGISEKFSDFIKELPEGEIHRLYQQHYVWDESNFPLMTDLLQTADQDELYAFSPIKND